MVIEPYKLLMYEYTTRNKFQIEHGYHPFNSLYIIQSGSFISESNGITNIYKNGDIVFFPPDMEFHHPKNVPAYLLLFTENQICFEYSRPALASHITNLILLINILIRTEILYGT